MSNLYFNNGNNKNQMFFYYGYISIVGKKYVFAIKAQNGNSDRKKNYYLEVW